MLLMAGIRERDKRAVAGFGIGISYHVCSMFAICSFGGPADTGLFRALVAGFEVNDGLI